MNSDRFGLKRFVFSRFAGSLCDQFLLFAVPLAILKATGSLTFSSLAFVIEWLRAFCFSRCQVFWLTVSSPVSSSLTWKPDAAC